MYRTRLQHCVLLCVVAVAAHGAPSWPLAYSYSPDSMPIVQIRLAPPRKPMPEVAAALSKLDSDRKLFETEHMLEVEVAYNVSLTKASQELTALIDRLMRPFTKSVVKTVGLRRIGKHTHAGATSFREGARTLGGHELAARVNVLPIAAPEASLETNIEKIEQKRTTDEGKLFEQAVLEMAGLSQIVQNEVEVQIARHSSKLFHALKLGSGASAEVSLASTRSTAFLTQPIRASGPQLTTNVRIMASEQPFYTVSSMVEGLEGKRDESEDLTRKRLLELELRLLQTQNQMVADKLDTLIEGVLQANM